MGEPTAADVVEIRDLSSRFHQQRQPGATGTERITDAIIDE